MDMIFTGFFSFTFLFLLRSTISYMIWKRKVVKQIIIKEARRYFNRIMLPASREIYIQILEKQQPKDKTNRLYIQEFRRLMNLEKE